jgi:hypothetical protein
MSTVNDYSELTIVRYNQALTSIKRLYEDEFKNDFKNPETFEKDSEKVMHVLRKVYNISTLTNFISAILWNMSKLSKDMYDTQYIESICNIYRNYGKEIKDEIERSKIGKEFDLTEKEKKSFMLWEDILKVRENILQNLDKNNHNNFLDFVIVSLYTLHPPVRADYANMKLFLDDSFIPQNYNENYCVLQTNPRFVFNKYKTSKHYGSTVVNMDEELHDILTDWCNINPSEYLLASYVKSSNTYHVFTEKTLCRRMSLIFTKYANIPVTINTLRHSFVSFMAKNDQYLDRKRENADKMMHSINMADKYRRMVYLD